LIFFELFEQLDNQGLADFGTHVFRVNASYLDPTALVQAEKDKTPKLSYPRQSRGLISC